VNEKRIQQVLDIEKQAEEIRAKAVAEADQIPAQAEIEAQELIERSRAKAQEDARALVSKAQAEQESNTILSDTNERVRATEVTAMGNFNRAVAYVLARVVGRE
jgi:F0F1-type ATP synthase membrane subunit b/b'